MREKKSNREVSVSKCVSSLPVASSATAYGKYIVAAVAGPLSPLNEVDPVPATVVMMNTELGLRLGYIVGITDGFCVLGANDGTAVVVIVVGVILGV